MRQTRHDSPSSTPAVATTSAGAAIFSAHRSHRWLSRSASATTFSPSLPLSLRLKTLTRSIPRSLFFLERQVLLPEEKVSLTSSKFDGQFILPLFWNDGAETYRGNQHQEPRQSLLKTDKQCTLELPPLKFTQYLIKYLTHTQSIKYKLKNN